MKRILLFILIASLFLTSCTATVNLRDANGIAMQVKENLSLLEECVREMEAFGAERIYVAMEKPKPEEGKEAETVTAEERLVSYEKESDDRTEIENPVLEEAITTLGLRLIFFQTAADSRRCVIFSFQKEAEKKAQGFYYSFDALPCGWWGRAAEFEHRDGRYFQANQKGDAWYYTLSIEENFYYFEKSGSLLA